MSIKHAKIPDVMNAVLQKAKPSFNSLLIKKRLAHIASTSVIVTVLSSLRKRTIKSMKVNFSTGLLKSSKDASTFKAVPIRKNEHRRKKKFIIYRLSKLNITLFVINYLASNGFHSA